jgi:ribosomal protein S12
MLKNCLKSLVCFRIRKIKKKRTKALTGSPQRKGDCLRVFKMAPKKPNSAKRSVARVLLTNKKKNHGVLTGRGSQFTKALHNFSARWAGARLARC